MKKLKRTSVGNVERENERDQTYEAKKPKIDLSRTPNNYHIIAPPQSYIRYSLTIYLCNFALLNYFRHNKAAPEYPKMVRFVAVSFCIVNNSC